MSENYITKTEFEREMKHIDEKLDHITKKLDDFLNKQEELVEKIHSLELSAVQRESEIKQMKEITDALKKMVYKAAAISIAVGAGGGEMIKAMFFN